MTRLDQPPRPISHQYGKPGTSLTRDLFILAMLALMVLLLAARNIDQGGLAWSDAPLHVMDGVMLHDLVREQPTGPLRAWAESYYLHYPSLGLIVYYPPPRRKGDGPGDRPSTWPRCRMR
jgi:hypothetical protein